MVRLLIAFIIFPSVWSFSLENGSSSSFNSPKALKHLQHRIENLEEPVWKVSKESNRWERCDETTQCSCNAVMKYVECIVNGSLYRSLTMPWDVEVIDLSDGYLDALSNRAFRHFPRLQELRLSILGLKYVSRHTFDHMEKLRYLILSRNEITEIDGRLFHHATQLEKIDLSQNQIEDLPSKAFRNCHQLIYLHLDFNNMTELRNETFEGLRSLEDLVLEHNSLLRIQTGAFDHFRQIENLKIAQNEIENLSAFTSTYLETLRELDLSHNSLQSIHPQDAFSKMHHLKVLNMERNSLEEFHFDAVPYQLETLNLQTNYIRRLYPSDKNFQLLYLDLHGNNLESLPDGIFRAFTKLQFLRMSNNMLTTLDFVPQLPQSISNLDLRLNLMERLEAVDLSPLVNLQDLYLSQNLWQCSCKIKDILDFHASVIKDKSETTCEDPQNLTEFPIQEAVQEC